MYAIKCENEAEENIIVLDKIQKVDIHILICSDILGPRLFWVTINNNDNYCLKIRKTLHVDCMRTECLCAGSALPVKLHLCLLSVVVGQQHGPVNTGTGFWRPWLHWLRAPPLWCHPAVFSLWTPNPTLRPPRLKITSHINLSGAIPQETNSKLGELCFLRANIWISHCVHVRMASINQHHFPSEKWHLFLLNLNTQEEL